MRSVVSRDATLLGGRDAQFIGLRGALLTEAVLQERCHLITSELPERRLAHVLWGNVWKHV